MFHNNTATPSFLGASHGLINYKDIEPDMSSLLVF
jgi:hypothetical protein